MEGSLHTNKKEGCIRLDAALLLFRFALKSAAVLAHGVPEIDGCFAQCVFAVTAAINARSVMKDELLSCHLSLQLSRIA